MKCALVLEKRGEACRVSIIIKALNEEANIVAAVESALREVHELGGEVVLADSCSSDDTVRRASEYPIRIVQLINPSERCCGIGPQLGYQSSCGQYVYIMDGDMVMLPGFLEHAIAFMDTHPEIAGVGGQVIEQNTQSLEYIARMERASSHMQAGAVDRLDMGGLYRRCAIEQAGYFSNRNLHSYEEFDLAVRLRTLGWGFWRLPQPSVMHTGHDLSPYRLLVRRWQSHYICGLGELFRAAIGESHFILLLTTLRELRLYLAVVGWWLGLASVFVWPMALPTSLLCFAGLLLFPFALMSWRKRSLRKAIYSVVSWCVNTAGFVRGVARSQVDETKTIAARVIR